MYFQAFFLAFAFYFHRVDIMPLLVEKPLFHSTPALLAPWRFSKHPRHVCISWPFAVSSSWNVLLLDRPVTSSLIFSNSQLRCHLLQEDFMTQQAEIIASFFILLLPCSALFSFSARYHLMYHRVLCFLQAFSTVI